jgi:hypothetical protein
MSSDSGIVRNTEKTITATARPSTARTLESWVRIPLGTRMSAFSGTGVCRQGFATASSPAHAIPSIGCKVRKPGKWKALDHIGFWCLLLRRYTGC